MVYFFNIIITIFLFFIHILWWSEEVVFLNHVLDFGVYEWHKNCKGLYHSDNIK